MVLYLGSVFVSGYVWIPIVNPNAPRNNVTSPALMVAALVVAFLLYRATFYRIFRPPFQFQAFNGRLVFIFRDEMLALEFSALNDATPDARADERQDG